MKSYTYVENLPKKQKKKMEDDLVPVQEATENNFKG